MVNCTYEHKPENLNPLPGTAEDAKAMIETFNHLNYIVHLLEDKSREEIKQKIKEVSDSLENCKKMNKEMAEEKVIILAFSGHGTTKYDIELLYANDGKTLELNDEIILPLTKPGGAVANVPKLFLIDACRGNELIAKRSSLSVDDSKSTFPLRKTPQRLAANYYIAYATVPHHVSYATRDGSLWMPKLAKAMWEDKNESFQNIVSKVMKEVGVQQQSNSNNTLTVGPLYLQKRIDSQVQGKILVDGGIHNFVWHYY